MRKTFARLDDLLIERLFQPASDLITRRMGLSNGGTICFCLDLASIAWIVSRTRCLSDAVIGWDAISAFLHLSFLLLGLVALVSLRILFRRPKGKQGNPLRPAMQPHRAVVLLMLGTNMAQLRTPDLAATADLLMLVFAAFGLYLGACAEQPPVRRHWATLAPAN